MGGGTPAAMDAVDWNFEYDPDTHAWTERAPMTTPRGYLAAVAMDGEIYAIGGPNVSSEVFNRTIEAYDPSADSWRSCALLPTGTMWPLYSSLSAVDGKIYKLAGGISNNPFDTAFVYDAEGDTWTSLPTTPEPMHGPGGAAIGTTAYIVGGYNEPVPSTTVIAYDTVGQTYEYAPELPIEVAYQSVVAVDDCLYSIGGHHSIYEEETSVAFMKWCP
jgi:N-acetylneuraminic acid mutarotase